METKADNTRVVQIPIPTKEQQEIIKRKAQQKLIKRSQATIQDSDKVKYYRDLQNFYNNNFFGNGMFGKQTHYDPSNPEDQKKIQASFDYAKSNVANLGINLITTGIGSSFKGILPNVSRRATIGQMSTFKPYKIGQGAEAIVIKNSPTTVGKITQVGSGEMLKRNSIPHSQPLKFVGYVRDEARRFPTFVQKKLKVLNDKTFPKYLTKLDNAMQKSGFRIVKDPNVQYRAYTNGAIVVDDVAPGNVGINIFKQPKLIDFNIQSVPNWIEQGFTLKHGGKFKFY